MATEQSSFRVIVVGGGMIGLSLAHILDRAGIDFVVLEKHKTVLAEKGSAFGIWPPAGRILDQMGLLERFKPHMYASKNTIVFSATDGHLYSQEEEPAASVERK